MRRYFLDPGEPIDLAGRILELVMAYGKILTNTNQLLGYP